MGRFSELTDLLKDEVFAKGFEEAGRFAHAVLRPRGIVHPNGIDLCHE